MKYTGKKVGVLLGGMSAEREVSFSTGRAVVKALRAKGYDVAEIDAKEDLPGRLLDEEVEVAYIALHGKYGEDGCVQGLLEVMKIPYTGASVISSAMALDKEVSNNIFETAGLLIPQGIVVKKSERNSFEFSKTPISLPVVVKPVTEGSSIGISIVREANELDAAFDEAFTHDDRVLVQKYIKGREITVVVLNGKPIGTVEVRPSLEFYNYEAKYTKGSTTYLCPAPIENEIESKLMKYAKVASERLNCEGAVRVDFILDENQQAFLLEINTLPGLTETSLVPMVADQIGLRFEDLVELVLDSASLKVGS